MVGTNVKSDKIKILAVAANDAYMGYFAIDNKK
jgi:hypothetical protein